MTKFATAMTDELRLRIPRGQKRVIALAAAFRGKSMSEYIRDVAALQGLKDCIAQTKVNQDRVEADHRKMIEATLAAVEAEQALELQLAATAQSS